MHTQNYSSRYLSISLFTLGTLAREFYIYFDSLIRIESHFKSSHPHIIVMAQRSTVSLSSLALSNQTIQFLFFLYGREIFNFTRNLDQFRIFDHDANTVDRTLILLSAFNDGKWGENKDTSKSNQEEWKKKRWLQSMSGIKCTVCDRNDITRLLSDNKISNKKLLLLLLLRVPDNSDYNLNRRNQSKWIEIKKNKTVWKKGTKQQRY